MHAVIMAGGKGERLWPKSTRGKAKHIISLGTRNVMIQETIKRLREKLPADNIFLITTKKQFSSLRPYVTNIKKENIILEPFGKDTAPAICLSALILKKRFGDATMVVLPADHIIKNTKTFFKDLTSAEKVAESGPNLLTIGIKPRYSSIGYGYIEAGKKIKGYYSVKRFVEKPKKAKAEAFYKNKNYLWNSGIFVWKTEAMLDMMKKYMPDLYYSLEDTCRLKGKAGYSIRLENEYSKLKPISIDYAMMEPVSKNERNKIFCIKADFDWVDIGSWSSIEEIYDKDADGNIMLSNSSVIDVKGCIIVGDRGHKIGAIGIKDIIIVQTKSGTLVCDKSRAQEVKDLVKTFKAFE
ncbi:MAG: mannose-1-phosphate guanylyltransferase [Candidatus Omnitrophica bacterium CG22_combo_CG10-13_8_21_14_all_43_16]|nr:MAG: mannose-1-phosphate guanylyltransferase [Candidatus Omnitrophica bacterium CG22_combo_CG10-13_8_21_14_all_43_16]